MKKLVVLFSAVALCLTGMAKDLGGSWVATDNGKIDCKKVVFGYNKARVVLENGQKSTVAFNAISSLSMDGKVFTKLPIYANGKPTKQGAFMQLIKENGELSLYRLATHNLGSSDMNEITYQYFLYKGNKMYLALNERTLANICLNFGVTDDEL